MNNFNRKKLTSGFTLIEVLIYVAILGIISVAVITASVTIMSSFNKTKVTRNILESGNNSLERMTREVRQAASVDIVNSSLGSHPGVLVLNSTDSVGGPRVVKFVIENGDLNIYQNSVLTGNLLNQNISISNLIFRRISTGEGEALKIEMTLSSNGGVSEKFYDTVILRGGY